MNDFALKNWIPYKMAEIDGQLFCNWLDTFDLPFVEPFFDETISKCRLNNNQFERPGVKGRIDMMETWAEELEEKTPDLIIFHVSRCGSTLVSQMFATLPDFIVLPEVPFFDEILRLPFKADGLRQDTSSMFRAALQFYVRQQNEKRLLIKTDSWHLFFYDQLREMYPATPFILLYRRPEEVYVSQQRQSGLHAVPGLIEPEVFGSSPDDINYTQRDIYFAGVLESYFRRMLDIARKDEHALAINYNDGPVALINQIADFADITLAPDYIAQIKARSFFHSKRPTEQYINESPVVVPEVLNKASALYEQLDEFRKRVTRQL